MQKSSRIGRHIVLAFLIFGTASILILGLSLIAALKSFETDIFDDMRYAELKQVQRQGEAAHLVGLFYSIYVTPLNEISSLPEHVRNLSQGTHEVIHDNQDYRVLVEHIGDMRYTVQFNKTTIHKHEQDFIGMIGLCSIVSLAIALVIGWNLAHQVIRPITQLSNQITILSKCPKKFWILQNSAMMK